MKHVISQLGRLRPAFVCLVLMGSVVLHGPAAADVPAPGGASGVCAGQGMSHVVKRYHGVAWGNGTVPLRCGRWTGTGGWGYRKLVAKGRWNAWFDGMIGATLQMPTSVAQQNSATIFRTGWFTQCNPVYRFVVVVEARMTPQGVISGINNAYQQYKG